jgi:hypothetical protein
LLFHKRDKNLGAALNGRRDAATSAAHPSVYRIDFDMMLKGAVIKRGKRTIRQYGVTVNGSTRLVNSGDVVDRETYEALLAVGAIRPVDAGAPGADPPPHPDKKTG